MAMPSPSDVFLDVRQTLVFYGYGLIYRQMSSTHACTGGSVGQTCLRHQQAVEVRFVGLYGLTSAYSDISGKLRGPDYDFLNL